MLHFDLLTLFPDFFRVVSLRKPDWQGNREGTAAGGTE
jgi:hypothetical protein